MEVPTRQDPHKNPMNREPHVDLRAHLGIFDGPDRLHPYLLSVSVMEVPRVTIHKTHEP